MKNNAMIFWLAIGLAAIASYGGWTLYRHSQDASATSPGGTSVAEEEASRMRMNLPPDGIPVPPFKLTDQEGKEFNSESLKGKVWVGSIFFASCPGPCYKLNQALANIQADHSLADVRFVSITCDPTTNQTAASSGNEHPEGRAKHHFKLTVAVGVLKAQCVLAQDPQQ